MLGHLLPQGDRDLVFRSLPRTVSDRPSALNLALLFLSYKHSSVPSLFEAFGEDSVRFLYLFAGMSIKVPDLHCDNPAHSLLPEISLLFGEESLQRFLFEFAGKTLSVPKHSDLESSIKAADCYLLIEERGVDSAVRSLSRQWGVDRKGAVGGHTRIEAAIFGNGNGNKEEGFGKEEGNGKDSQGEEAPPQEESGWTHFSKEVSCLFRRQA